MLLLMWSFSILVFFLLPPPRRVLCQKRPKKMFLLISLMISSHVFLFVLSLVPLRQWEDALQQCPHLVLGVKGHVSPLCHVDLVTDGLRSPGMCILRR